MSKKFVTVSDCPVHSSIIPFKIAGIGSLNGSATWEELDDIPKSP
jgi:hypothetical protein